MVTVQTGMLRISMCQESTPHKDEWYFQAPWPALVDALFKRGIKIGYPGILVHRRFLKAEVDIDIAICRKQTLVRNISISDSKLLCRS